jgi:hypothetical protein
LTNCNPKTSQFTRTNPRGGEDGDTTDQKGQHKSKNKPQ